MKRKFFSVVVAACAAFFSFSGLTGCSGGSEQQQDAYGVVTLDDFQKARKGFKLAFGQSVMNIKPIAGSGDGFETEGNEEGRQDTGKRTGSRTMLCTINNSYQALVTYTITSWPQTSLRPVGDTTLYISFDDAENGVSSVQAASKDAGVIAALGGDYNTDTLISSISIRLDYGTQMGGSTSTFAYKKGDGTPATETVDAEGTFVVVRY